MVHGHQPTVTLQSTAEKGLKSSAVMPPIGASAAMITVSVREESFSKQKSTTDAKKKLPNIMLLKRKENRGPVITKCSLTNKR